MFRETSSDWSKGIRALARLLKANEKKCWTKLDLSMNPLGDEGVIALIDGLESNTSLLSLELSMCSIADDQVVALASLLENGSHLEMLNLEHNNIQVTGMKALANSLKCNQHLKSLYLRGNPGPDRSGVAESFINAFANNVTLLELDFFSHELKSPQIKALLLRNKEQIPAVVRSAALLLIVIRQSADVEEMGDFAVFPKDIIRLIAQTVWATRRDPIWIQALK